jgi:hypothetical protein
VAVSKCCLENLSRLLPPTLHWSRPLQLEGLPLEVERRCAPKDIARREQSHQQSWPADPLMDVLIQVSHPAASTICETQLMGHVGDFPNPNGPGDANIIIVRKSFGLRL